MIHIRLNQSSFEEMNKKLLLDHSRRCCMLKSQLAHNKFKLGLDLVREQNQNERFKENLKNTVTDVKLHIIDKQKAKEEKKNKKPKVKKFKHRNRRIRI